MRAKGINYDTGAWPAGRVTRPVFDAETVRRDMRVIADELHCTAVRVTGGDPERMTVAAEYAAEAGLEVWFAPFLCELTTDEMLPVFADCARRAEELRRGGAAVVFVAGAELSIFARGFLPGDDLFARLASFLDDPARTVLAAVPGPLNAYLGEVLPRVRKEFGGPVTYASVPFEQVEWDAFDYVGADAYRHARNAGRFREEIRELHRHGKPVAITEFGCCTYRGAADRGGGGWMIFDGPVEEGRLDGVYVRDEQEQAQYLREVLADYEAEGVDSAFWFTFSGYKFAGDLDLASYGVVRMTDRPGTAGSDMMWDPKASFHALAETYESG